MYSIYLNVLKSLSFFFSEGYRDLGKLQMERGGRDCPDFIKTQRGGTLIVEQNPKGGWMLYKNSQKNTIYSI